jgi:arabinose-5-phosphate isomerase
LLVLGNLAKGAGLFMDMPPELSTARRVIDLEITALAALRDSLDGAFVEAVQQALALEGRVICSGIGKSGHIARKIAATLASTGTPAYFVHAGEASHGDLGMITSADAVLALSRSGETRELDDLVHYCRRHGVTLIAMTAVADSALGRAADILLAIPDVEEACAETRAPTSSTTMMIALGDALAVALLEARGFRAEDFKAYHPGGKLGASLQTAGDLMHTGEELPLVKENARLEAAIAMISQKGLGCVGVVDGSGQMTGILTDGDVRRLVLSAARPEGIAGAMHHEPIVMAPEDLAADILRVMNGRKIMQVFIVEKGRPVGLIHMHDLLVAGVA